MRCSSQRTYLSRSVVWEILPERESSDNDHGCIFQLGAPLEDAENLECHALKSWLRKRLGSHVDKFRDKSSEQKQENTVSIGEEGQLYKVLTPRPLTSGFGLWVCVILGAHLPTKGPHCTVFDSSRSHRAAGQCGERLPNQSGPSLVHSLRLMNGDNVPQQCNVTRVRLLTGPEMPVCQVTPTIPMNDPCSGEDERLQ